MQSTLRLAWYRHSNSFCHMLVHFSYVITLMRTIEEEKRAAIYPIATSYLLTERVGLAHDTQPNYTIARGKDNCMLINKS